MYSETSMDYQNNSRIEQYKSINREFALKTQQLKDQLAALKFENVLLKQELFDKHEKLVLLINVQNEYAKLKELSIKLIRNCTSDFNKCINDLLERFNYSDFPDFHTSLSLTKQTSEKIKRQSLVFVQTTVAESEEVFNQLRTSFTSSNNSSSSTTNNKARTRTNSKDNTSDYYHTDRINLNSSLTAMHFRPAPLSMDPVYSSSPPVRHIQVRRGTGNSHRKSNDFKNHNQIQTSIELQNDDSTTNTTITNMINNDDDDDDNKKVLQPVLPTRTNALPYNNLQDLFPNQKNDNNNSDHNNNDDDDDDDDNDENRYDKNEQADLINNYEFANNEMDLNDGSNKRLFNLNTINECTGEYQSISEHSNESLAIGKEKLSVNLSDGQTTKTKQSIVSKSPRRVTSLLMPRNDNDKDTMNLNESSVNMTLTNVCSSTPYKKLDNKENVQPPSYTKVSTRSQKKRQNKKIEMPDIIYNIEKNYKSAFTTATPPRPSSSLASFTSPTSSASTSTLTSASTSTLAPSSTSIRRHTDRPRRKASASNVCLQEPSVRTKLRR